MEPTTPDLISVSPPSSIKSEPMTTSYAGRAPSPLFTPTFDTSIDSNATTQFYSSPHGSSIYIDAPIPPPSNNPYDLLQGFSAPTLPVYINMGHNTSSDDVSYGGQATTTTNAAPISRSLASMDMDHHLPTTGTQRHSHHHHFPHHAQNRNRYPYLQRTTSSKALHRQIATQSSLETLPFHEQRPAFRRAYFALRRQRIPKAPPMPKHLFPGFKQHSKPTLPVDETDDTETEDEESEEELIPSKSLWIILRLVFFFFAIEFMYAVETALTVPILTSLHVPESFYSMAWLISPILGFFLQPMVGMWSDSCKCRWGRRRPFILAFAIGAYIGVALLLNSSDLGILFGDIPGSKTIPYKAVILTAIGVTLLDFCADSADAPIRAYLIDTTNTADQERGFNIHAILGFGGGLGFLTGAIEWEKIPFFIRIGGEFRVIFIIATILFIVCTTSTLTSVREEPLISSSATRDNSDLTIVPDDEQPEIGVDEKRPLLTLRRNMNNSRSYNTTMADRSTTMNVYLNEMNNQEGFVEVDAANGGRIPHDHIDRTNDDDLLLQSLEQSHQLVAASMATNDPLNPVPVPTQAFETELKQKAKLVKLGLMRRPISEEIEENDEKDRVTIKSMLISMVRMPAPLWKLMVCQVIGWVGYFATHLYFTDFMATAVYNGTSEIGSERFELYKAGIKTGCWGLFLYSASSAIYAFCLERWLAEKFSQKTLYFSGYIIYALGCVVNYYVHNVTVNIIMCITFGILVVTLNTLPYHMLSQFHADETYLNKDGTKRGIGVDCSLLNSCYFLGELIVAVSLGPLIDSTSVNTCMLVGAVFALFGNMCMCFLFYFKK